MVSALDLRVDLGRGLRLPTPVLVASGTFGYGFDAPQVDRTALGAIITKGTTPRARRGNEPLRIAETPSGMLNAIGLQNPGVEQVAREYAPTWATWRALVRSTTARLPSESGWWGQPTQTRPPALTTWQCSCIGRANWPPPERSTSAP